MRAEETASTPEAAQAAGEPAAWRRWLGYGGGAILGLVLLAAAWAKALDPAGFAESIQVEGLDILLSPWAVAVAAVALEVLLGVLLLLGVRRWWVLVPATLLVAFFLLLNGRTLWLASRGLLEEGASCGCFGNLVDRTPAEAFWQDLLLLVPPLALAFLGRRRGGGVALRAGVAVALTLATVVFTWQAPGLPLDDLATRLRPGVATDELCAGREGEKTCVVTVIPELVEGEHLVVLGDLTSPELGDAVAGLNALALDPEAPTLWLLSSGTAEEVAAFYWQRGPAFEVREAPQALLRPLYRRLPRSFWVEDGTVVRTYSGLPPLSERAREETVADTTPREGAQGDATGDEVRR